MSVVRGQTLGLAVFEIAAEDVDGLVDVPPHEVGCARAEDDERAVVADERAEAVVVALLAVAVAADQAQPAASGRTRTRRRRTGSGRRRTSVISFDSKPMKRPSPEIDVRRLSPVKVSVGRSAC